MSDQTSGNAPLVPQTPPSGKPNDPLEDIASTLRDLFNRVPETVNKAVEKALNVKDTTVVMRLSDDASEKLDLLVQAGVFKNRTEASAFLIEEGIKAQAPLFQRIQDKMTEIEKLRSELRNTVAPAA
ncbi:MAG: hypothetical protein HOP19_03490 [Acidobacteria bacterium]|nr:hypothetical protein [Acidobacteriota bacterium]